MKDGNPTDRWGCGLGTQAATINEYLSEGVFLSAQKIYERLVRKFPSTIVGRVRQHIQFLRKDFKRFLREERECRRVKFWLQG